MNKNVGSETARDDEDCYWFDGRQICEERNVREVICVKTASGAVKCGKKVKIQRAPGDEACVIEGDGSVWCGEEIARFAITKPDIVCVTEPCPTDLMIRLEDIVNVIIPRVRTEVERFQRKT